MNVLITGASSGIGYALTLHYLKHGCSVAAIARRETKLQALYQEPQCRYGHLKIYAADVTQKQAIADVVAMAEKDLGPIELAIANAGITAQNLEAKFDLDRFEQIVKTNVMGVANTIAPVIDAMLLRGRGQIVGISSMAALHAMPRISAYSASKVALNYLLEGLYRDLKPHGIHVTTICPSFIDTDMTVKEQVPAHLCMQREVAIAKIVRAIEQRRRFYCFPYWSYHFLNMLNILPNVVRGSILNYVAERWFPRPIVIDR
ncbi:SDR family NAD(P)-dependent oxidoreductase [Pseudanabaena sp. PCC 6802]|uniref:SDR family NAD(P)-dependent oxidoreductase n=1 Tax=Pseudanabaena sp. PCC 6802 TaxID=118173 RepID=UPI00034D738D|nr:SDR family NAD(P)-dependent oxidoreductase [Pseudanabaena sp. PCC 6802]